MPFLRNAEKAIVPVKKIRDYALNPDHVEGGHKARVFRAATGLTRADHGLLIEEIRRGILRYEALPSGSYEGQVKYQVDMPIAGPTGTATLRTAWIYEDEHDGAPRLVTAYIL